MDRAVAVLVSGGLDSAVLCAELAKKYTVVFPIYIHHGLPWETRELVALNEFFTELNEPTIQSQVSLNLPVTDLYESHWSMTGDIPGAETDDSAVYLPGKNLLLLAKASVWCERNSVNEIALATLDANPFQDNTPEFYSAMSETIRLAMGFELNIIQPFRDFNKAEVIRRGANLPLGKTFSCIQPIAKQHCGRCNKCQERRIAFQEAKVVDSTVYA